MSKGAKDIDIVVIEEGRPEIKKVSAKNPLQAYKTAVKTFCPPETGGSNILKKEADLTKNVLPMLYKAFSLDAEPSQFHGNALALIMSQTPELATIRLPDKLYKAIDDEEEFYDTGSFTSPSSSDIMWVALSGLHIQLKDGLYDDKEGQEAGTMDREFLQTLKKYIVKEVGVKRLTAMIKSAQSLIKSIVFYFRFINQPQLLVCDDDDYISLVSDFIGDALTEGIDSAGYPTPYFFDVVARGGGVRVGDVGGAESAVFRLKEGGAPTLSRTGMFRTVNPYELLPVPVYSRSVFKAQPDKEKRFLEVYGLSALRMGFTTLEDMPKLDELRVIAEEQLGETIPELIKEMEEEAAFLDQNIFTQDQWVEVLKYTDRAEGAYDQFFGKDLFQQHREDGSLFDTGMVSQGEPSQKNPPLTLDRLRAFVRNGWTPDIPLTVDEDYIAKGKYYLKPSFYGKSIKNKQYYREEILKQISAIRNATKDFDEIASRSANLEKTLSSYERDYRELQGKTQYYRDKADRIEEELETAIEKLLSAEKLIERLQQGGAGILSSEELEELSEVKEELEEAQKELEEAQERVLELEELEEQSEVVSRENELLKAILERIGVNVNKVLEDSGGFDPEEFVNSSEFDDLVVEPIERSLFR